jgi:hypothetical protein
MPNLPMHIHLAHRVAEELDWGFLHDHLGSYFLGSTTPDIRAMAKWDRERTHFAPLSVDTVGSGAKRMFELNPDLSDHRRQSPATLAFLLGYLSHLTADELWITTMYRPHFGTDNQVTDTEVEAHIWDRALQLDMDRQVLEESRSLDGVSDAIALCDQKLQVGFLDEELIQEWQQWVARFLGWDFSWQRLKRALNRMFRDNDEVQQVVDQFLLQMPNSLEEVYAKIPRDKLVAYQRRVQNETLAQVREYLGET